MLNKLITASQKLSPGLRKVLGNTIWLFADQIVRLFLSLLVGIWVARYLGPEKFGVFNYAIAFAALFAAFAKLGLDSIVVRDITRDPTCKDEILGTSFILKLIGSLITLVLAVGIFSLVSPGKDLARWLVGIVAAGTIFQSFEIIDFWFQSQVQSKYTVWAKNVALIIVSLVRIWLIQIHASLIAFAVVMIAEYAIAAVGFVIVYQRNGNFINAWKWNFNRALVLLKDSWPLILSSIVIIVYMRIDQIMIGQIIGDRAVGIYSAAVRISEMWYFVPLAIVNSVFPSIVKAKEISEELYYDRLQKLFNLMTLLSYTVAIPVTIISNQIVWVLYGKGYAEAAPLLTVHIWTGVFVSLGVARSAWLITEGLMTFSAATSAIGAGVNVLLNLVLIKWYGGMGAAIATVIAQFIAAYASGLFFPKTKIIFVEQTKAIFLIGAIKSIRR